MAQPVTDDELQLRKRARRRLVGAIVLVLLVVVFLPMALDNEPKPLAPNVDIQVPALDSAEKKFPATAPPLAVQSPSAPAPEPGPTEAPAVPKAEGPVAAPEVVKPALAPEPEKKPEAPKKPDPAKKAEATKPPSAKAAAVQATKSVATLEAQGYVVQLGAFSNAANANQLYEKLRAARFPAYLERVNGPGGAKTRVRVGPFPTEDAADKARQKLLQVGLVKGNLKIAKQGE